MHARIVIESWRTNPIQKTMSFKKSKRDGVTGKNAKAHQCHAVVEGDAAKPWIHVNAIVSASDALYKLQVQEVG